MHFSMGHVTLLSGGFQPLNIPASRTYGAGWTHAGLCPKFIVSLQNYNPFFDALVHSSTY